MKKKMNRVKRQLTAAQQARVDRAREAAEGVDRDDLIRQANAARELHDVMTALKAAREAAGLSLRELEQQTGISRGNLSRLEQGTGNPTIATLRRYAEAIGRKLTVTVE